MKELCNFFVKCNRSKWCIFVSFAILLFAKCIIFHWNVYHSIIISSLWTQPLVFWGFWLPKISMPILLASFVFFFKRNGWTIVAALIVDIWILANMFYLRSNGILFNAFTFTMASNMDGYWSSVFALFQWADIVPFIMTLAYGVVAVFLDKFHNKRLIKIGFISLFISLLLNTLASSLVMKQAMINYKGENHQAIHYILKSPLSYQYRRIYETMNNDYAFYNFSVIHALPFLLLDNIHNLNVMNEPYQIPNKADISARLQMGDNSVLKYDNLLLILIVESFESWALNDKITPNICKFMDTHPVLYAKYLKSQIIGGSSADGQMIINTGLLPIKQGATCFIYPWITFPSLTNREDSSATILTHGTKAWNQEIMSEAYGYNSTLGGTVQDSILSKRIIDYAQRGYKTIQGITVASHVPFEYDYKSKMSLPDDMPTLMKKYLKCLNWTDDGLGYLLDRVDSIPELQSATIVITGDHTIFWKEKREEFANYCLSANIDMDALKGYVPLIIYSPTKISEDIVLDDINYQMDIYPTVLNLLDTNYYWIGFGENLLDSAARNNRHWTETDAYEISDKLIRANWFETYNK